uniref:F-box associated domain-containing protein n=1 Tax=Oryza rufipogon TaxID=4529 RepID=A0A0E0NZG9_ORYRU
MEEHHDVTQLLPDDVLAGVLARRAWRAVIDTRRLLRADLLPLSLAGIYINFHEMHRSVFLSRPSSTRPAISGMFTDYTPNDNLVEDHCNGLLLLKSGVANPATRQWVPSPPAPPQPVWMKDFYRFDSYLVFDPTISTHYEIFKIPQVPSTGFRVLDPMLKSLQWPPSLISLSDNKYQVIKLPMNTEVCQYKNHFLGRSMRGVHYALIDNEHRLRMTWELKHDNDLSFLLRCQEICTQNNGPWTLQYHNYFGYPRQNDMDNYYEAYKKHIVRKYHYEYESVWYKNHCEDIKKDVVVRVNNFEWDSDNDDILDTANPNEGECHGYLSILGFHPYKEVIFLNQKRERGLAYHFNSSKVQNLGNSMEEHHDDVTQLLSDDVLADVLARLAPRWLDRRVPLRLQGMARHRRHPPPAPR